MQWRYLVDAGTNHVVHSENGVVANIDRVLTRLESYALTVTRRAAANLEAFKGKLAKLPKDAHLSPELAKELKEIVLGLQTTLQAEANGNVAYVVTEKRLDIRKLLSAPQDLFAPNIYAVLPEVARFDFSEAGMCIAFERPTAAAFHLLRGTEDVLRVFYRSCVKKNRISPLLWGPMTDALRNKRTPPPQELLGLLDHIRRSFRNPTQHPDKIYDIQEAQDLYALCVDATNRMAKSSAWNKDA